MILAGDIGGTTVSLALFDHKEGNLDLKREESFISKNYSEFESILQEFFEGRNISLEKACFGVDREPSPWR